MFSFQTRLSQWWETSPGFAIRLNFKVCICYFQAMSLTASYFTSGSPKFICKMVMITVCISGEISPGRRMKTKAHTCSLIFFNLHTSQWKAWNEMMTSFSRGENGRLRRSQSHCQCQGPNWDPGVLILSWHKLIFYKCCCLSPGKLFK